MKRTMFITLTLTAIMTVLHCAPSHAANFLNAIDQRFAGKKQKETPDFQKHVVPLLSKLGCNGRACHGSFQGQGGFQLSLFGYDFKMDHEGLSERVDTETPDDSYALLKATLQDEHKGGKRTEINSWEYNVLREWIAGGAKGVADAPQKLVKLEITPKDIVRNKSGEKIQLKAVATWEDGSTEDVTPLCRFDTRDEQVAKITENGLVETNNPGDTHVIVYYDSGIIPVPVIQPVSPLHGSNYPAVATRTEIDRHVVDKLRNLGMIPADLCSDAEFLRRVSLDITGSLPTAQEAEQFLNNSNPDKRTRKIDELLERPTYAAWWATKLNDYTGNNPASLVNVTPDRLADQQWYDWIYRRVEQNVPYDQIVAGIVLAVGREQGMSYKEYSQEMSEYGHKNSEASFADRKTMPHYWARRTIRNADDKALSFAYSFMGIRIQCAQCHKHPFDQWTQDDFAQFSNFFSGVRFGSDPQNRKEHDAIMASLDIDKTKRGGQLRRELAQKLRAGEVVPFEEVYVIQARKTNPNNKNRKQKRRQRGGPAKTSATILGGEKVDLTQVSDPRQPLMDWLKQKDNPYLAKAFVNRVWANYFSVGIVNPPDDLSLANPPSNKPLLDYLSSGFIASGYDMKWLHREIANSDTYQRSWKSNETNKLDEKNFSRAIPRRLPAEVVYDALKQAASADKIAQAMQNDLNDRAIASSGYNERSRRNPANYALKLFGVSTRESNCDCDRSTDVSLLQTLYVRNDKDALALLESNESWLNQLAGEYKQFSPAKERTAENKQQANFKKNIKRIKEQIAVTEKRIEKLKADGNTNAAQQLKKRLKAGKQRIAQLQKRVQSEHPAMKADRVVISNTDLVKQAYLRTLSRYPTDDELDRSVTYLESASEANTGMRDLMWALLNTKEFIVNH